MNQLSALILNTHFPAFCHKTRRKHTFRSAVRQIVKKDVEFVNPLVFDGQKLLPSVTRVFSKTKDLFVFLQAYERSEAATQPLVAFVTFYRGEAKAMETAPLAMTGEVDPKTRAMPLRFGVPLEQLAPGRYDIQVSVLEPGEAKATFWRAPIVVVP